MTRVRDHLRKGRRALHSRMSRPALYFKPPYRAGETVVTPINVRTHDKFGKVGDLKGTNHNYVEFEDNSPRLIFDLLEIEPERNYVVSVDVGEAYVVDTLLPPDGEFATARVARSHKSEAANYPIPATYEE